MAKGPGNSEFINPWKKRLAVKDSMNMSISRSAWQNGSHVRADLSMSSSLVISLVI
jgi:hypothetical protein